jgi:hypothetical protein
LAGGFSFEDGIFKALALGAPYTKAVCMGRALMIPGMVGKNIVEAGEIKNIPLGAIGIYSYAGKLKAGLQQLMFDTANALQPCLFFLVIQPRLSVISSKSLTAGISLLCSSTTTSTSPSPRSVENALTVCIAPAASRSALFRLLPRLVFPSIATISGNPALHSRA